MAKKATGKAGRVLWVEPNDLDLLMDNGVPAYEDYSICVDLEVEIPKRSACGNFAGEKMTFHINSATSKDKISFFTGTDGFLSTSFTDISSIDPKSNKETLGISSINIIYNSYFYPQVTINFVDVRGSSLMYPQESMVEHNTEGSFFKALFCFPYPVFKLRVKGFYGRQVEYDLAVEDFRTSFNSETGNFECVVKFIGYMYGIYTDLPMSYLIAAPYIDMGEGACVGKKYWDSKNSTYTYTEGGSIDTFINLKSKLLQAETKLKGLLQNSDEAQKKKTAESERDLLHQVETTYNYFRAAFDKIEISASAGLKDTTQLVIYNTVNQPELNDVVLSAWGSLNKAIIYYNEVASDSKIEFIGGFSGTTVEDLKVLLTGGTLEQPEPPKKTPQSAKGYEKTWKADQKTFADIEAEFKSKEAKLNELKSKMDSNKAIWDKSVAEKQDLFVDQKRKEEAYLKSKDEYNTYKNGEYKSIEAKYKEAKKTRNTAQETYNAAKSADAAKERKEEQKRKEEEAKRQEEIKQLKVLAKEYTDINKFITEEIKENAIAELLKKELEGKEKVFAFVYNNANVLKNVDAKLQENDKKISDITKEIAKLQNQNLAEILGFTPTLENIFRIIFAHIDTFMETYYYVLNQIKTQNRKCKDFNINSDNSDVKSDFLPPFPLIVSEEKGLLWPKNYPYTKDIIETELVEGLFKGIKTIEDELKNAYAAAGVGNGDGSWNGVGIPPRGSGYEQDTTSNISIIPANLSDFYFFVNPYSWYTIRDNISIPNVYSTIGYRLSDIINIKYADDTNEVKRIKLVGDLEAANFIKSVPSLDVTRSNMNEFNSHLTNYSQNTDTYKNAFIAYISNKKEGFKDVLNVESTTHGTPAIFDGDKSNRKYTPVNFTDIPKMHADKSSNYYDVKFKLTPIDRTTLSYFIDVYMRVKNSMFQYLSEEMQRYYNTFYNSVFDKFYNMKVVDFVEKQDDYRKEIYRYAAYSSTKWYNAVREKYGTRGKLDLGVGSGINISLLENYITSPEYLTELKNMTGVVYKTDESEFLINLEKAKRWRSNMGNSADAKNTIFDKLFTNNGPEGAVLGLLEPSVYNCHVTDPSNFWDYSLYGCPLFYAQNHVENEEQRLLNKAYLFLEGCAPMSGDVIEDFPKNVTQVPYWTILLLGARLWRGNQEKEPLYNKDTGFALPDKTSGFIVEGKSLFEKVGLNWWRDLWSTNNNIKTTHVEISKKESDYFKTTNNFKKLNKETKEFFIQQFTTWAKSTFPSYNDILELKYVDGTPLYASDITDLCSLLSHKGFNKDVKDLTKHQINKILKEFSGTRLGKHIITEGENAIDLTKTLESFIHKDVYYRYAVYYVSDKSSAIKLILKPFEDGITKKLFNDKLDNFYFISEIATSKILASEGAYKNRYNAFMTSLNDGYKKSTGTGDPENPTDPTANPESSGSAAESILRNDDMKLSLYLTLKSLYDKWLCGNDRNKWSYDLFVQNKNNKYIEFNKFHFIDSFYNDISNKMFINGNVFTELIDSIITNRIGDSDLNPDGMRFQGISVYEFMASTLQKNSMMLLAVPGFTLYQSEQDVQDLFTPFPWFDKGKPLTTSYIGIYPHRPSTHLDIDGGPEYQFTNDGFNLTKPNGELNTNNPDIPDLYNVDGGYMVPAFGVDYAKQDQSYFKKVTVNMDTPQQTEFSIAATLNIANKYASNQKVSTFIGQDTYRVYSDHSYTCSVEMMGNAMISPMMYFQLNNIPLFRGAYLIYKVSHDITPGNMTTTFTGMRMSKYKIPYVTSTLEADLGNGGGGIPADTSGGGVYGYSGKYAYVYTEGTTAEVKSNIEKYLTAARSVVGVKETGVNYVGEPTDLPIQGKNPNNTNNDLHQWCCIFTGWCSEKAGLKPEWTSGDVSQYKGVNWKYSYPNTCQSSLKYWRDKGRVFAVNETNRVNNPPQSGDLLYKEASAKKKALGREVGHIAIVQHYNPENNKICIVHGNTGNQVKCQEVEYGSGGYIFYSRPTYGGPDGKLTDTSHKLGGLAWHEDASLGGGGESPSTDFMLKTKEEKLRFVNACIWQESENKSTAHGDKNLKNNAYGILQIRKCALEQDTNWKRNKKANMVGSRLYPVSEIVTDETVKKLTRNQHVQIFVTMCEVMNGEEMNSNDIYWKKNGTQAKSVEAIPWSFQKSCAVWNCGSRKKSCTEYVNAVKAKYDKLLKNPNSMPKGDADGWTAETAFNAYFNNTYF